MILFILEFFLVTVATVVDVVGILLLFSQQNFTSRAVMDALGSCLTNKYSEGLPNAR